MGCENTLYECNEHAGIVTARCWRYIGLLAIFLSTLIGGILLIIHFPTSVDCPPSFNVQGLGILFIILSCCTCTQSICYWYDAKQVVHQTSTQPVGDLLLTVKSASHNETREVFSGVDIGHKVCSSVSSCWQVCGFLSCFGIGLALMTQINSDGTVIVTGNSSITSSGTTTVTTNSTSNPSSQGSSVACDGQSMYMGGLVVVVASLLFFLTMCWRVCRDPQTMMVYRASTLPQAVSTFRDGATDSAVSTSAVELTMQ